jgi:hypothetical protein
LFLLSWALIKGSRVPESSPPQSDRSRPTASPD